MMRNAALALVLFVTACGRGGGGDESGAPGNAVAAAFAGESRDATATLALAASGPGGCSARWDGQPVTPQQVLERSSALIEQAITRQGGVANLTDETLPTVAVTAPASLSFGCVDTYLAPIRRTGVRSVLLAPDSGGVTALADFTPSDIGPPPPLVVLSIGAGGRLSWNNEAIGLDAIPERLERLHGGVETLIEAPPGELELRPTREATFGQVHQAFSTVRASHVRAALLLPSIEPARPLASPPAGPVGNEAALGTAGNEAVPRP